METKIMELEMKIKGLKKKIEKAEDELEVVYLEYDKAKESQLVNV